MSQRGTPALVAQAAALERLIARIRAASTAESEWPFRVRAGLGAAIRFAVEEPGRARLLCVESFPRDPVLAQAALAARGRLAELLRPGRREAWLATDMPSVRERAVVDAIATLVAPCILRGESRRLLTMEPQLARLALLPYVGTEAAAQIATTPRHPLAA